MNRKDWALPKIEKVVGVLEKFDGDGEDRVIREKVFIEDGVITKTEIYDEDGNYVETLGGKNGTN